MTDPIRAALQAAAQEVGAQVRSPDSTRGDVARTAIIAFLRALPDAQMRGPTSWLFYKSDPFKQLALDIESSADAAEARK